MGLVDGIDLEEAEGGLAVTIRFRPDNPHCPIVGELTEAMMEQARRVRGVARVQVVVCPPPEVDRHA